MSLKSIVHFCAVRPFYVIGFWIFLVFAAGFLSQMYLDQALKGGQGPTRDLESGLAQKLKEEKLSLPNAHMYSTPDEKSKESDSDESGEEEYVETILVVTSDKYLFPSEQYLEALNGFLQGIQLKIDANEINRIVGSLEDYAVNPSQDGTTVTIPAPFIGEDLLSPLVHFSEEYSDDDFRFYFVGVPTLELAFEELAEKDLLTGETIGVSVALIILALVFGSVVSAMIPVILAIVSIFISIGLTAILGQFIDLNDFVPNIMTMMGLAVGIDYCLFILSRYREERFSGQEKTEAIVKTGRSAGRAVMFSGLTVVLALLGMFVIPEKTFQAFGVGAILVVFVAVMASLTLLPAIIGVLGDRVNHVYVHKKLTIAIYIIGFLIVAFTQTVGPKLLIASGVALGVLVIVSATRTMGLNLRFLPTHEQSEESEGGFWNEITLQVMKRPVISVVLASGILLILGYFYFDLEKGTSGISVLPDNQPAKIGFMVLDEKYGFGSNEPVNVVIDADIDSQQIQTAIQNLKTSFADDEDFLETRVQLYSSVNFAEFSSQISGDPQNQTALNLTADPLNRLR